MKREQHKCDICGKTEMLESGKRHWCKCNLPAPFYMHSEKLRKMIDQLLVGGRFMGGRKKGTK